MKTVQTTCGYCGCGCNSIFTVENDAIVSVAPRADHPVNLGKLCAKGWQGHGFARSPDRLTRPLVRQPDGSFCPVPWEEALALVSRRFHEIIAAHGPLRVGALSSARCTNEENYLLARLTRAGFGSPNIDHCARLCHSPTVAGLNQAFGSGAMTNSIEELRHASVILVVGSNTTEQHPLVAERIIAARQAGTATLIVIDPRRTVLAAMADMYLPVKPGSDLMLVNALCKIIMDEKLENTAFIEERTEGYAALKEQLAGLDVALVAEQAGVPLELLTQAARAYAAGPDSSLVYCMGITQHTSGTANCLALCNLVMLCGMVGRPSVGLNPLRGQNNVQGACDMGAMPNVLPGYAPADSPEAKARFAPVWGEFAAAKGLALTEMMHKAGEGYIKALFVMGENPVLSDPDSTHIRHALEKLDFLVVQDIFMTESARYAHVVLPAASWLEKSGTFTNTERRVQKINPVLSAPGEARPDWQILTSLLQGMGQQVAYASPEDIFTEIRALVPAYAGMSYQRIEASQGLCWPCPHEGHPGTPYLHKGAFTRGKGLFTSVFAVNSREMPDAEYPLQLTTGRVGFHYHTGTMTRRSWTLEREFPENFVEINPYDADALGLWENRKVRISSRRGAITALARITEGIVPGVVFVPFHFSDSPANVLTGNQLDPVALIPSFKASAVRVEGI